VSKEPRSHGVDRRLPGHGELERGDQITLLVDGHEVTAYLGETVAGALMATAIRTFRETFRRKRPRGLYCGMGVCYDCLVVVDGRPNTRACMTYVADGMRVDLQQGWGEPQKHEPRLQTPRDEARGPEQDRL
jgi:predicted molibdopterin-dependent oxidoreductase YjgC